MGSGFIKMNSTDDHVSGPAGAGLGPGLAITCPLCYYTAIMQTKVGLSVISLEEITPDNWRLGLRVSNDQEKYVSDRTHLLARAYAYRERHSRAVIICSDGTPVGMALYYDCDELDAYDFSQLFIDERYQGKGYGLAATECILDEMRKDGRFKKVVLCYTDGNQAARSLYEKCGFHETGESDGNEIVMEKILG